RSSEARHLGWKLHAALEMAAGAPTLNAATCKPIARATRSPHRVHSSKRVHPLDLLLGQANDGRSPVGLNFGRVLRYASPHCAARVTEELQNAARNNAVERRLGRYLIIRRLSAQCSKFDGYRYHRGRRSSSHRSCRSISLRARCWSEIG